MKIVQENLAVRIGEDPGEFLPHTHLGHTTKNGNTLKNILQRASPYPREIIFNPKLTSWKRIPKGTIQYPTELCPNLNRLKIGNVMLSDDDWLACSNLEALSLSPLQKLNLGLLFRRNKRLRRLEIFSSSLLIASDFDQLDPGQLEFLHIGFCSKFEFTDKVTDKLAESLINLKYSLFWGFTPNLQYLGKLKNLRSLELKVGMRCLGTQFIADIVENCRKLECLFLAISSSHAYDATV